MARLSFGPLPKACATLSLLEGFINAHFPPVIPGRTPPEAAVSNLQPTGTMNHADLIKQLYTPKRQAITTPGLYAPHPRGRKSSAPCQRCGAYDVYVTQDSNYDADYDIHCYGCTHHYRVDGPDY